MRGVMRSGGGGNGVIVGDRDNGLLSRRLLADYGDDEVLAFAGRISGILSLEALTEGTPAVVTASGEASCPALRARTASRDHEAWLWA